MSLCWQTSDPLEESPAMDAPMAHAKRPGTGGVIARLAVWRRQLDPDLNGPVPDEDPLETN